MIFSLFNSCNTNEMAFASEIRQTATNIFARFAEIGELIYRQKLTPHAGVMGGIILTWCFSVYIIYLLCRRHYAYDEDMDESTGNDSVKDDLSGQEESTGNDSVQDESAKDDLSGQDDSTGIDDLLQRLASLSDQVDDLRAKSIPPLMPEFLIIGYQTITVALATEPMMMTLPIIIQSGTFTWYASSLPAMAVPTMNIMTGMMMPSQCPCVVTISLRELMRLPNLKFVEGIDVRQDQLYIFSAHFQMPIQLTFYDGTLANWVDFCSTRQIIAGVNIGGGNSKPGGPYLNTRQRSNPGIRKKKYT
jgi:hypothetical protein